MNADLKWLIERLPPLPDAPLRALRWDKIEAAIGLRYPESFKEFINTYGGCFWCDFLNPVIPLGDSEGAIQKYKQRLIESATDKTLWDAKLNDLPYRIYPDEGCLLPFAQDVAGGYRWWVTSGEPDQWDIWAAYGRDPDVVICPQGTTIPQLFRSWLECGVLGRTAICDLTGSDQSVFRIENWKV